MTTTEPNVSETGRYPIGETAKLLGLNRTTVWRHVELGNIKPGTRKSNDRKFFTGREIKRFWNSQY